MKTLNNSKTKIGVIMPAYNAEKTILKTIERIPVKKLIGKNYVLKLYIVNDGSTDNTANLFRKKYFFKKLSVKVITHKKNKGYGAAQKTGLQHSLKEKNKIHVILHSDGQYAPEELPKMIKPLTEGNFDLVIGSKFKKGNVLQQGMPLYRLLGIKFFDLLENLFFGSHNLEFHSGYMAYTTNFLLKTNFQKLTDKFHFDGEMVREGIKQKTNISIVPISTCYNQGISSLRVLPYSCEVIKSILKNLLKK